MGSGKSVYSSGWAIRCSATDDGDADDGNITNNNGVADYSYNCNQSDIDGGYTGCKNSHLLLKTAQSH